MGLKSYKILMQPFLGIFLFPATLHIVMSEKVCNTCDYTPTYQHVIVSGLPYDRGFSHGQQAKEKIIRMINYYKGSKSMPPWEECVKFVEDNYIEALKIYYPNGLEEMTGIAEAVGVSVNDIIILNARYDLSRWKRSQSMKSFTKKPMKSSSESPECLAEIGPTTEKINPHNNQNFGFNRAHKAEEEECTGAVALKSSTLTKEVLLGQNWDTGEFILKNDTAILLEVRPDPCENIKPFVTLTEAGQLVRSGMNSDGLGLVAMSLWSSNEVYEREPNSTKYPYGWVPATLLRRMFLEAPTFPLGMKAILATPRHVAMNVIIATAEDEALNVELTPDSYFVTRVPLDKEVLTHSNHFKDPSFTSRDSVTEGSRGGSSLFRDRRVEKSLLMHWPNIEVEHFQEAFKDHVGYPNSVCEHSVPKELAWTSTHPSETTVASLIFNLSQKTMLLCKGPPCQGTYKKYTFDFSTN